MSMQLAIFKTPFGYNKAKKRRLIPAFVLEYATTRNIE
jgi:hypothetical protein